MAANPLSRVNLSRQTPAQTPHNAELEAAQVALPARYAPDARIPRVRWSGARLECWSLALARRSCYYTVVLPVASFRRQFSQRSLVITALVVDLPDHGLANPFDYRNADLLDLRAVDNVANSLGGLWCAAFTLTAPERVRRLALVGAAHGVNRWIPVELRILSLPGVGQAFGRRLMVNRSREANPVLGGDPRRAP